MSYMDKLTELLDHQANERRAFIAAFNARYKPVAEAEDPPELVGNKIGVFNFDGAWYFACKNKNGYIPEELILIPAVAVEAISNAS